MVKVLVKNLVNPICNQVSLRLTLNLSLCWGWIWVVTKSYTRPRYMTDIPVCQEVVTIKHVACAAAHTLVADLICIMKTSRRLLKMMMIVVTYWKIMMMIWLFILQWRLLIVSDLKILNPGATSIVYLSNWQSDFDLYRSKIQMKQAQICGNSLEVVLITERMDSEMRISSIPASLTHSLTACNAPPAKSKTAAWWPQNGIMHCR